MWRSCCVIKRKFRRRTRSVAEIKHISLLFFILFTVSLSAASMAMYGTSGGYAGDDALVSVAESQIGNRGGKKYWKWYGFDDHVDWCACFVSWCLYKSGADEPKFAVCDDGMEWFKSVGRWQDKDVEPETGAIIFFDWDEDGVSDHTGIVKKCEGGWVHTIEGNIDDKCCEKIYDAEDKSIVGYGFM